MRKKNFRLGVDKIDDRSYIITMTRMNHSAQTRKMLLDHGLEAFIVKGYNGTGLKEILDEAGVPKGSFYNYFESKEQFGAEVIRHYAAKQQAQADTVLNDSSVEAPDAIKSFFQLGIEGNEEGERREGCLVGNLGAELGETSEPCRQAMAQALGAMEQKLSRVILRGQKDGSIRKDVKAEELAGLLLNAWQGMLIRMKIERSCEPLRKFQSLMVDSVLRE